MKFHNNKYRILLIKGIDFFIFYDIIYSNEDMMLAMEERVYTVFHFYGMEKILW